MLAISFTQPPPPHPHLPPPTIKKLPTAMIKATRQWNLASLWNITRHIFYLQNSCRKRGWETSFRSLIVFWKSFVRGKSKWSAARSFNIFRQPSTCHKNKNKRHKTFNFCSRDMLNFDFLEKSLGIVSPPHFAYNFSRKMLYYILTDQISLSDSRNFLDIGQYVYCNYLLSTLWRHKFWN